jgi:hypothetical protein
LDDKGKHLMNIPISYKGNIYELEPILHDGTGFRVYFRSCAFWGESESDFHGEDIELQLGAILFYPHLEWFECLTTFNGEFRSWADGEAGIDAAVAFVVDHFRPCQHSNSSKRDGVWNCDHCGKENI